jgi:hypothetical protein
VVEFCSRVTAFPRECGTEEKWKKIQPERTPLRSILKPKCTTPYRGPRPCDYDDSELALLVRDSLEMTERNMLQCKPKGAKKMGAAWLKRQLRHDLDHSALGCYKSML